MLSKDQVSNIKEQIISQIKNSFEEDKKHLAIKQIEEMDSEELEEFLIKNNLIKYENNSPPSQQCIFCSIATNKINSVKIDETPNELAVLEINPLEDGHSLIIPKKHSPSIPKTSEDLAMKIKEKIKSALNPRDILLEHGEMFGHGIINLIPVYTDELKKERKKASDEELKKIQIKIKSAQEKKVMPKTFNLKKPEVYSNRNYWLPKKRIP